MFRKNVVRVGIVLHVACCCARAQDWTEQAVLAVFDQQSPIRRESRAAAAAAVEAVRGRTLWPNPVAIYSRETSGFTEFVEGEQLLPLSGRLKLERQALEPARTTAEAEGAARLWDARSLLRVAFYRALSAQLQADLIQSALVQLNSVLELLRLREQEGEGSRYDRVRVEREAADLRADVALVNNRARSEVAAMTAHLPVGTSIIRVQGSLSPGAMTLTVAELEKHATDMRADIRAESARLVQLDLQQQVANRLRIPEPLIAAGTKRTQVAPDRNDTGAVVTVSIPLPVFNKGQTEVARLSAEQERTRSRRDILIQQVNAAVAGAYDVYVARLDALRVFDRETGAVGAELLRTARVGYEEGELGILQLLDALRLDRQTALRRLELQASVKDIEIELSRVAGFEVTQ
jgi:cobalt-zinc-cadmium efflux system outer membrane protein